MIVCITEHYDGNGSVTWFADTSKARPEFAKIISKAFRDSNKTVGIQSGFCGWQNDIDRNSCDTPLPCRVDKAIEIYTE